MVNSSLQCENTEQHIACSRYVPKKGRWLVGSSPGPKCERQRGESAAPGIQFSTAERRFEGELRGASVERREALRKS